MLLWALLSPTLTAYGVQVHSLTPAIDLAVLDLRQYTGSTQWIIDFCKGGPYAFDVPDLTTVRELLIRRSQDPCRCHPLTHCAGLIHVQEE